MAGVHTEEVLCCFCRGLYTDVYGSMTQLHVMHSPRRRLLLSATVECADNQQEKYEINRPRQQKAIEKSVTEHDIDRIVCSMYICGKRPPTITKHSAKTRYAEQLFKGKGLHDKERLLHYRRSSRVNLYELDGVVDYFYGLWHPRQACSNTLI